MLRGYLGSCSDDSACFDPDASVVGPNVAALWERIAYLQAVKCSPVDGRTGSPTGTMRENCPPRYLLEELRILDPTCLLVLGKGVWEPVARALEMQAPRGPAAVGLGQLTDGRQIKVFFVVHPSDPRGMLLPVAASSFVSCSSEAQPCAAAPLQPGTVLCG